MSRMTTIVRIALYCSLFAALGGCASMYGKSQDPDANRLGMTSSPASETPRATR